MTVASELISFPKSLIINKASVNIEVLYRDHDHQLILVVDDIARERAVSDAWTRKQVPPDHQT